MSSFWPRATKRGGIRPRLPPPPPPPPPPPLPPRARLRLLACRNCLTSSFWLCATANGNSPQHLLPRAARLPAAGVSLRQRLPAPRRPPWAGKGQTQVR